MSERLKYQGRLAEMELEEKSILLKMQGLRDAIRDQLDPLESLEVLALDVVAQEAMELAELQIQLKELQAKIEKAKKLVGDKSWPGK